MRSIVENCSSVDVLISRFLLSPLNPPPRHVHPHMFCPLRRRLWTIRPSNGGSLLKDFKPSSQLLFPWQPSFPPPSPVLSCNNRLLPSLSRVAPLFAPASSSSVSIPPTVFCKLVGGRFGALGVRRIDEGED